MKKLIAIVIAVAAIGALFAGALPAMAAGGTDFVCPVFNANSQAGEKNPNAINIGDGTPAFDTILPGLNRGNSGKAGTQRANHLDVPDGATNGNGTGVIHGAANSAPGDSD